MGACVKWPAILLACGVAAGCSNGGADRPSEPALASPGAEGSSAPSLSDITLAEAKLDADGDGSEERLRIVMTDGTLEHDDNPGPFQGDFYVGRFSAVLSAADGSELTSTALSVLPGEPMRLKAGPVQPIAVEDYNGDGAPDFTVGQYGSSNVWIYSLYTVKPDGITPLVSGLASDNGGFSKRFPLKPGDPAAFLNRYYNNAEGHRYESTWSWNGTSFVRTGQQAIAD